MKPIIGILIRKEVTNENHNVMVIYENVYNAMKKNNCTILGIDELDERVMELCDGIIAQGGDDIRDEDKKVIEYAHEKNIPLLGICLGMQEMSYFYDGKLDDFTDSFHKQTKDYVHEVKIKKGSFLYNIIQKDSILVNSRHKSYVKETKLNKSAYFNNIIEAVEDDTKKFFLGVQWHPESMLSYDEDASKIIDAFIKACEGDYYDN